MCHSDSMSALLSAAPTVAFTTLLTQCTPYLPLVPTVMPTTFTNPSPPPSTRCPNLPPYFHTRIAQGLSSAPHPPQVPSRAFWRCNVYGISGARTSTLSPMAPARLPGDGSHMISMRSASRKFLWLCTCPSADQGFLGGLPGGWREVGKCFKGTCLP